MLALGHCTQRIHFILRLITHIYIFTVKETYAVTETIPNTDKRCTNMWYWYNHTVWPIMLPYTPVSIAQNMYLQMVRWDEIRTIRKEN
jgi:hypothetical protein